MGIVKGRWAERFRGGTEGEEDGDGDGEKMEPVGSRNPWDLKTNQNQDVLGTIGIWDFVDD